MPSRAAVRALVLAFAGWIGCGVPEAAAQAAPRTGPATRPAQNHVGDFVVAAGDTVGSVEVMDGDLIIRGLVEGDAAVVGGNLIVEGEGVVTGNASVVGGDIQLNGGEIFGDMRTTDGGAERRRDGPAGSEERSEEEDEGDLKIPGVPEVPELPGVRDWSDHDAWWSPVWRGFAGLVSTLALGVLLAVGGALLLVFAPRELQTVADTASAATTRSFWVGVAATVLAIPAYLMLVIGLIVTILGIPLAVIAAVLAPVAVAAAIGFGLLGAAHVLGERTATRSPRWDLRFRNSYGYLGIGVAVLLAPFAVGYLLTMTGFLGWLGTLLRGIGWTVLWLAATVGLGAVLLSRGGKRRDFAAAAGPAGTSDPDWDHPFRTNELPDDDFTS